VRRYVLPECERVVVVETWIWNGRAEWVVVLLGENNRAGRVGQVRASQAMESSGWMAGAG
jgi:hypothetical protein